MLRLSYARLSGTNSILIRNSNEIRPISQKAGLIGGIIFSLAFTVLMWIALLILTASSCGPTGVLPSGTRGSAPAPLFWTRISVWGLYAAHQITIWFLIWKAQSEVTRYSNSLNRVNVLALAANAGFIGLHFVQTHVFYDGLALDVPEQSSQWSVILLLVIVLLMENRRRGLFFGVSVRGRVFDESSRALRKYQGYYFDWATIYTFWYHPMVSTPGHLLGFLYMFLMLLQGSLFFTRIHTNKWWMLTQEVLVLVHGTIVALSNAPDFCQMFCFGFAGLFIVTQMHGLGLSIGARWGFLAAYVAAVESVYSRIGLKHIHQITWIPLTEYAVVFAVAGVVWAAMKFFNRFRNGQLKES